MSEEQLIGEPASEVPKRDPGEDCNAKRIEHRDGAENLFLGYCNNIAGKGTDHKGTGRCEYHGGNLNGGGEDHPAFKHGLFSDVLSEDDREDLEAIEGIANTESLQKMINYELLRLRRAISYLEDQDEEARSFWDAFEEIIRAATETGIDSEDIRELAGMLDSGGSALMRRMDQIRKMIKTYEELTGGKKLNIDQDIEQTISGGSQALEIEWKRSSEEINE